MKIKCPYCYKDDKVFKVWYGKREDNKIWIGYECERCYAVVKEIVNKGGE